MADGSDDLDANVVPFPRGHFEKRQNEREAELEMEPVRPRRTPRRVTGATLDPMPGTPVGHSGVERAQVAALLVDQSEPRHLAEAT